VRPLKLELEGFTAFRQRTCLDFGDLDLFAVTGPTGAGKSSLIDAICYALYGRVPRVTAEVNAVISQGHDRMQVSLEFQANGRAYRVLREARRKGSGNTRLEQMGAEDWQPIADRAREVTSKVEEIVGLDYEAFIRSVILPQGQFQEFLAGSPERRREVLDRLLRVDVYKRMQARAGQQTQFLLQRQNEIERRLRDELADATPEAMAEGRAGLARIESELQAHAVALQGLQRAVDLARQLADARNELTKSESARSQAEARLTALRELLQGAEQRRATLCHDLEAVRAELGANAYDDVLFAALAGAANLALNLERARKASAEAERKQSTVEKRLAEAAAEAKERQAQREAALAAVAGAESVLAEARRHDLAAALKAGLKPGDTCPVCGGCVGDIAPAEAGALEAAEASLSRARSAEEAAHSALNSASTGVAVAQTELDSLRSQLNDQRDAIDQAAGELATTLPDQADRSLASIQACLQEQRGARQSRHLLEEQESKLTKALAAEEAAGRDALQQASALEAEARVMTAAAEASRARVDAAQESLLAVLRQHALSEPVAMLESGQDVLRQLDQTLADASDAQSRALTRKGELQARLQRLERDIETARQLRDEQAEVTREHNVTADMSQMLQANRFQAFVQAQALRTLAHDGTRKLLELSGGRYELEVSAAGQDFMVLDRWNDGEARSVRTLSGGETFLASLALALALAETLPGLAPTKRLALESIFLDEGFGSLDTEALDRAADALDALRSENRMVCIVTHLPELASRLPARVVVTKSESGSTVAIA
jgi:exonuclease SbcC